MKNFKEYLERKRREHGNKFDPSSLDPKFIPFYENGKRIEVTDTTGYTRRGRIGVTTGWKPAFLLMHRRSDHGSCDVLRASDTVVRVVSA